MALSISCRALGFECNYVATGTTVSELLDLAGRHDVEVHGESEARVHSSEWREEMRAVIRNVSRPPTLRGSEPDITQVNPVDDDSSG